MPENQLLAPIEIEMYFDFKSAALEWIAGAKFRLHSVLEPVIANEILLQKQITK